MNEPTPAPLASAGANLLCPLGRSEAHCKGIPENCRWDMVAKACIGPGQTASPQLNEKQYCEASNRSVCEISKDICRWDGAVKFCYVQAVPPPPTPAPDEGTYVPMVLLLAALLAIFLVAALCVYHYWARQKRKLLRLRDQEEHNIRLLQERLRTQELDKTRVAGFVGAHQKIADDKLRTVEAKEAAIEDFDKAIGAEKEVTAQRDKELAVAWVGHERAMQLRDEDEELKQGERLAQARRDLALQQAKPGTGKGIATSGRLVSVRSVSDRSVFSSLASVSASGMSGTYTNPLYSHDGSARSSLAGPSRGR